MESSGSSGRGLRLRLRRAAYLGRFDPSQDGIWSVVSTSGSVEGGIIIDGKQAGEEGAQLRFFILHPELHRKGYGRELLGKAVEFCDGKGYERVFLWTVDELEAAIHLYREAGFEGTDQVEVHTGWMTEVPYRLYERIA